MCFAKVDIPGVSRFLPDSLARRSLLLLVLVLALSASGDRVKIAIWLIPMLIVCRIFNRFQVWYLSGGLAQFFRSSTDIGRERPCQADHTLEGMILEYDLCQREMAASSIIISSLFRTSGSIRGDKGIVPHRECQCRIGPALLY